MGPRLGHLAVTAAALVLLAGCSAAPSRTYEGVTDAGEPDGADTLDDPDGTIPRLRIELAADGYSKPLFVTHAGDGSGRFFVVEQAGRIRVSDGPGGPAGVYLDIRDAVSSGGERGLLSAAFSPDFASDRALYVYYTDLAGDTVVSRLRESDGRADPGSEEVLLSIDQPYSNHNGGQLAFGADGYLYVGTGDGGSADDPQDNAQDPYSLLGKLLRLDVSGDGPYSIPADNPWADGAGAAPEVWALGLRNPWRFSFDRETGDLWIGDVGQNAREEIDFQPAASDGGENYGWRVFEGTRVSAPGDPSPKSPVMPVTEYGREEGFSVTGGYVYRGPSMPGLTGVYLFADYGSGTVWGLLRSGSDRERVTLFETDLAVSSFGEDEDGELYLADLASGGVYTIVGTD